MQAPTSSSRRRAIMGHMTICIARVRRAEARHTRVRVATDRARLVAVVALKIMPKGRARAIWVALAALGKSGRDDDSKRGKPLELIQVSVTYICDIFSERDILSKKIFREKI